MVLALVATARWVHFGAAMILFGSALFQLYAPARKEFKASATLALSLQRYAAVAALVASLAWAAVSVVMMTDDPMSLLDTAVLSDFLFATQFGTAWIVALILAVAIVAMVFLLPKSIRLLRPFDALIVAAAGALLVSQAWLGHAAGGDVVQVGAYGLHVLAVAAWLGGLPMLAGFLVIARRDPASNEAAAMGAVLSRFSLMGMIAVAIVLVTGLANSWFRLASPRDLISTPYGQLIDIKFILFCGLIVVAAQNRFALMPRLAQSSQSVLRPLLRNVCIEQILAAATLAAAAVLGLLSPSG